MIQIAFTPIAEGLPEFRHHCNSYGGTWDSDWLYILTSHGEIMPSRLTAHGKADAKPVADKFELMRWEWTGLAGSDYCYRSVASSPVIAWAYAADTKATARKQGAKHD